MKAGWEVRALGEVATIINGGTPKSEVAAYWDGDVDWLTPKDMGKLDGHLVHVTPRRISREGLAKCSARQVPANSVIMSTRAPIGHLAMNTVPMAFNQGCRGMVPGENLDAKYLFYVLSANVQALDNLGTGTTFKELSAGSLKAFPIPLPPLDEQKRIVEVLDAAFEGLSRARAHTETNLQNARELFESELDQAFESSNAEQTLLGSLISIAHGYAFDGADFEASQNDDLPIVLTPGNYTEDAKLSFESTKTKRLTGPIPSNYLFEVGELTVVMTDLSSKMKILGKPAFIEHSNILHNQRIGRISFLGQSLDCRFLYYFLRSSVARKEIKETSTGTMVRHTAPKRILALSLPVPTSILEQQNVVARLDELSDWVSQLQSHYRAKLADLDGLRQSLLQKAFAGELT